MIDFQTLEETRIDDVVAALERMRAQQPDANRSLVSAKLIGEAIGMGYHQTLIYLHMAAEEGRAMPVRSPNGGLALFAVAFLFVDCVPRD